MKTDARASQPLNGRSFTFSQSSLQDYVDCPRRFQLRYLKEMAWPAVAVEPASEAESRQQDALLFHRMVQQNLLGLPPERLTKLATSANLARWWQNYLTRGPSLESHELHTELILGVRIGEHRLICKYDLLATAKGKAVIYDWKTFARRPKSEWLAARLQTRVYRAMLVKAGAEFNGGRPFRPADISMIFWFSEYPQDPAEFPYDEGQYSRDTAAIENLVREIVEAKAYALTDDPTHCRFCVYRSLCDRGQRAGTAPEHDEEAADSVILHPSLEQIGELQV